RIRVPARDRRVAAAVHREGAHVRRAHSRRQGARSSSTASAGDSHRASAPAGCEERVMPTEEFFIGYEPPVPPRLARFIRRVVVGVAGSAAVWVIVLAAGHVRLQGGTFEFGHPRTLSGRIVERPYPSLQPEKAAGGSPPPSLLLVAPGKHG